MRVPFFAALILAVLLAATAAPALSAGNIRVKALFPDKAMIEIDGRPQVLAVGEEIVEGMLLIAADFEGAVIEVNGERRSFGLDDTIGGGYAEPAEQELRIVSNASGAFFVQGRINGQGVPMIVDTGASFVALSRQHARQLGIEVDRTQTPIQAQTASGITAAYPVVLDRVQVGPIERFNVRAAVIDADHPPAVLLGMTFLRQLDMQQSGNLMVLRSGR